jgi:pimeloyl-ACP methyl ester carboxylesterase
MHPVVTWNAPSNLHELANDEKHDGRGIGVAFFTELATHKYDTTPSGVGCHLIVHGDADDVVPLDHATVLHSRAAEPCDIVVIEGGDHRLTDPEHRRDAVDVSLQWFRRFLAPTARPS